jgi:hypothetical protein
MIGMLDRDTFSVLFMRFASILRQDLVLSRNAGTFTACIHPIRRTRMQRADVEENAMSFRVAIVAIVALLATPADSADHVEETSPGNDSTEARVSK